ncbi:MAG TPA: ABC transporter ATP-binding protein [Acidimicrobiales bacterium]|nr:ABC transporter ATP-binding protein [Acidimicrobiales bacterium]
MAADAAVVVEKLSKHYRGPPPVDAVKSIDLEVARGEIFGLLGPNGAGKTTTVGMCTTRVVPTAGRVTVDGVDVRADPPGARGRIGVVTQFNTLDRSCTVFENLKYHCRYFGMNHRDAKARAAELLDTFRLADRADANVMALSGGMAQRLQVARSIAHRPVVLFLDEPTSGLDPQSRIALWEVLGALHDEGTTVILTTHYMEEADRLCDRLAIIDYGEILVMGTPDQLKRQVGVETVVTLTLDGDREGAVKALSVVAGVDRTEIVEGEVLVYLAEREGPLPAVVQAALAFGLVDLALTEPTLETVFIQLTGRALRD